MKKFIGTMTAFAVAFSASAALAGVYVSGPLPSEFSGGYISPNPDINKSQGKGYKEGSKLAGGIAKCLSKGAKNVSKGKASGLNTCLNDTKKGVIPKFNAKVAGITPGADCSLGSSSGPLVLSILKNLNAAFYCQSPSGAFVDGVLF